MLLGRDATVTVCHANTREPRDRCLGADILISAVGKPGLVKADWVRPGAVVVDVGISRVQDKICGDVCYEEVGRVASMITPVPGGVGPLTVASLLANVVASAENTTK